MKAVIASDYGPAEQFTIAEIPVPEPGPGQIQIRVAASSVNPADVWVTSGAAQGMLEVSFAQVLGNDVAGTVTAVGEGVSVHRVGDEVFGMAIPRVMGAIPAMAHAAKGTGAMAEYVVVDAGTPFIVDRPRTVSPVDAAALATAGLTANAVVTSADLQPGESVLVVGATGGVGTAVISLLAGKNVHVTATSTPADTEVLRALGADRVIGYDPSDYPSGIDVALNLTLPSDRLPALAAALRPGGRLYTITDPFPTGQTTGRADIESHGVGDTDGSLGGMRRVAELLETGQLQATIGRHYTLDQAPQAYADLENRHILGKLVVTP